MTQPAADTSAVLTAQDSLVLASMATPAEMQLVMEWLGQQRTRNPETRFDVLKLPPRDASPAAMTALVEQLESARRPVDRAGEGVLAAGRRPRQGGQGGRTASGPRSLPPQPTSAASNSADRAVAGTRGGGRVGQRLRTSPSNGATPPLVKTLRSSPSSSLEGRCWHWRARSTASLGRNTNLLAWSSRRCWPRRDSVPA